MRRSTNKQEPPSNEEFPRLLIPKAEAESQISARITLGTQLLSRSLGSLGDLDQAKADRRKWSEYNSDMLKLIFSSPRLSEDYDSAGYAGGGIFAMAGRPSDYERLMEGTDDLRSLITEQVRQLESIRDRLSLYQQQDPTPAMTNGGRPLSCVSNKVFIVHGQDVAARESVARFVETLGLEPIILAEQPGAGQSLIEKLESHSDVGYAVVLLTPDDIGGGQGCEQSALKSRARQNVIFELGFFCAKLGRTNVCSLYVEGVELPSDYHGVQYIPLDDNNGWHLRLAKQLKAAGFSIDVDALVR